MWVDRMPDMHMDRERRTEVMFIAKPVCRKRVLNFGWSVLLQVANTRFGKAEKRQEGKGIRTYHDT
jgi:hypothetical protein